MALHLILPTAALLTCSALGARAAALYNASLFDVGEAAYNVSLFNVSEVTFSTNTDSELETYRALVPLLWCVTIGLFGKATFALVNLLKGERPAPSRFAGRAAPEGTEV